MSRTERNGAAALAMVVYMHPRAGQWSLFPRMRAPGLNLITYDLMPETMSVWRMGVWLRLFERSGHTKLRRRTVTPLFRYRKGARPHPSNPTGRK